MHSAILDIHIFRQEMRDVTTGVKLICGLKKSRVIFLLNEIFLLPSGANLKKNVQAFYFDNIFTVL